jgi:hypothetical protein
MPIDFRTHETIVGGAREDLDRTVIAFSIGEKSDLSRKALATVVLSWRALQITPSTAIIIHFGGYDDDPRELWQIPEVCGFIQKFCAKTRAHEHPAVEPASRDLLLACGADPNTRVAVNMISPAASIEKTAAFIKDVMAKDRKP